MSLETQLFETLDLRRASLNEQIADQIQEMINTGRLRAGDRLPSERDLAGILGVNRATVREAVQILEQRGLVDMKPGSGAYVTEVSPDVVGNAIVRYFSSHRCSHGHLQEVRMTIEPEIAALAAKNATDADLQVIADNVKRLERAWEIGDSRLMAGPDSEFHQSLAIASHNDLFVAIVSGLSLILERDIAVQYSIERAASSLPLHRQVYEAVAAGDSERARHMMRRHMELVPVAGD